MVLAVVVLLAALAVGRLAGGTLARLAETPVRRRRLAGLALAAQVLGVVVGGPLHAVGLAASAGLVVAFLAVNRGLRGTGLVAAGLLANALVVGANGAMPVSLDAAARAGVGPSAADDARHEPAGPGTRLRLLGDVVPVPLPGLPSVVSPGDVLVAAGLAQLVVAGMLRPRPLPVLPDARGRQRRALPPSAPSGSVPPVSPGRPAPTRRAPAPAAPRLPSRATQP